jgi:hypothetical protein
MPPLTRLGSGTFQGLVKDFNDASVKFRVRNCIVTMKDFIQSLRRDTDVFG